MEKTISNAFIHQTAKDYDMNVEQVQGIYDQHNVSGKFYEKLEEFIEQRKNTK